MARIRASRAREIKRLNRVAAAQGRKERTRSLQLPASHGVTRTAAAHRRLGSWQGAPHCRRSKLRKPRIWHEATRRLSNRARRNARRHLARQPDDSGDWRPPPSPFRVWALQVGQQPSRHRPGGTVPSSTTIGEGGRASASHGDGTAIQDHASRHRVWRSACMRISRLGPCQDAKNGWVISSLEKCSLKGHCRDKIHYSP